MAHRYRDQTRVLRDVRWEKDEFLQQRIWLILDELNHQPAYVTRTGQAYHYDRGCADCRSFYNVREHRACAHCTGAFGRRMLRRAREILGIPPGANFWDLDFAKEQNLGEAVSGPSSMI